MRFPDRLKYENKSRSVDKALNGTDPDLRGQVSGAETRIRSVRPRISPLASVLSEMVHVKRRVHAKTAFWAECVNKNCLLNVKVSAYSRAADGRPAGLWIMYAVKGGTSRRTKSRRTPITMQTFFQTFRSAFAAMQWQRDYHCDDLLVMGSVYWMIIM
jgi:hypothetical protein